MTIEELKTYLGSVDRLLESRHERFGGTGSVAVNLGDVTMYMDETDAKYLSKPVEIHKVLMDKDIAFVIGDFSVPWEEEGMKIRWLLAGLKNERGRYQLTIMHELHPSFNW